MNREQLRELKARFPGFVALDEPMSRHTSFKVGGPADALVMPGSEVELADFLDYCHQHSYPVTVIGNGSNLLVRDKGIRGAVLKIGSALSTVTLRDTLIEAEVGISLASLAQVALDAGLGGLEFAAGIPGSLGGGIIMNAGAYGGEMKDVVQDVWALDYEGRRHHFTAEEMAFGYRTSALQNKPFIITRAAMLLSPKDPAEIRAMMMDLAARRRETQPLHLPSAGSVFKRPPGYYAGPLIEQSGLKGARIGGAEVSRKHAGFIVNIGEATAADVEALIRHVQATVKEKFGVQLETEVRILGEA